MLIACTLLLCFLVAPVLSISGVGLNPGITVKPGCTKPQAHMESKPIYEYSACGAGWQNLFSPATIQFSGNTDDTHPATFQWNFGDGTTGTGMNPVHTYNPASQTSYSVSVTATTSCGSDTVYDSILVGGSTFSIVKLVTSPSDAYKDSVWTVNGNEDKGSDKVTPQAGTTLLLTIDKAGYKHFEKSFTVTGGKNICIEAGLVSVSSSSSSALAPPTLKAGTTYVPPVTTLTNNPAQSGGQSAGQSGSQSGQGGSLFITSAPSGAAVFINNNAKGTTPATLTGIVPGTYTVLLKKSGYPDYATTTSIVAGQVTTINADLTKGPQAAATNAPAAAATTAPVPGEGSLSVSTTPQGAQVFIDGVVRGMTPATIPGLSAGQHTVLLKLDGYQEFNTTVSIPDGKTAEFNTALAKTQKSPGFAGMLVVLVITGICLLWKRAR